MIFSSVELRQHRDDKGRHDCVGWVLWNDGCTSSNDWDRDEIEPSAWESLVESPEWNRGDETNGEADKEVLVSAGEEVLWSDETPDDGGGVEDVRVTSGPLASWVDDGSVKVLALGGDDRVEDGIVDDGTDNGSPALSGKHESWRDFEVVAELEIGCEQESLVLGHVSVALEGDVGDWATWKHVTADELGQNVETDLEVGDGLDDTGWDDHDESDQHGDDDTPPWKGDWEDFDDDHRDNHGDEEKSSVPPGWDFWVDLHETGVDIFLRLLVLDGKTDILLVPESNVDDGGNKGNKADSV